jgi:hypothetical protein
MQPAPLLTTSTHVLGQTKTDFTGYGNTAAAANCSGCQVHTGFYRTYESVRLQVQAAVAKFQQQHPSAALACTGHSLGAAVAEHAALDLSTGGLRVDTLYNFGQPRTGNSAFSAFFDASLGGRTFRVTHHKVESCSQTASLAPIYLSTLVCQHWKACSSALLDTRILWCGCFFLCVRCQDPVPQLPFQRWGFHHEPLEIFYNERNTAFAVCDGSGEDPTCSDQYKLDGDVLDHLDYLNFDFSANYILCKL